MSLLALVRHTNQQRHAMHSCSHLFTLLYLSLPLHAGVDCHEYLQCAERVAEFVHDHLYDSASCTLFRSYRAAVSPVQGMLLSIHHSCTQLMSTSQADLLSDRLALALLFTTLMHHHTCVLHAGFADDYACLIQGLLDLYEAGGSLKWLKWSIQLQQRMDELFWDPAGGEVV